MAAYSDDKSCKRVIDSDPEEDPSSEVAKWN
jgi:hypothetical protein